MSVTFPVAAVPGCFFAVGGGGAEAFPHHHPRFEVDEAAIPVAIDVFVRTALEYLGTATSL
jgi:amidohydrolase